MSYILEALKKSQQERELGRVPTLETPSFPVEEEHARPNLWILLAVSLAALAVVIALYSALRSSPPVGEPAAKVAQTAQATAHEFANPNPVTGTEAVTKPPTERVSLQQVPVAPSPRRAVTAPPTPDAMEPGIADSPVVVEAPAPASVPESEPRTREGPTASEEPQTAPERERASNIPSDLIADIEAFKREVRDEKSVATDAAPAETEIAPQDLRLPDEVRKRLPELVMSAHIYDEEPTKRFVLINGLKTREGEESLEEITVVQILPDGAVLSFDGHRFFQRR